MIHAVINHRKRSLGALRPRHKYQLHLRAHHWRQQTVAFPHPALYLATGHAVADLFADGKSRTGPPAAGGRQKHHLAIGHAFAPPEYVLEFRCAAQAHGLWIRVFLHDEKSRLARLLCSQYLAAFATPARNHLSTCMRFHAGTEAMYLFTLSFFRLISL